MDFWRQRAEQIKRVMQREIPAVTVDPAVRVSRFEVIDKHGRVYAAYPAKVDVVYQDGGRTLKVFVEHK